MSSQRMQELNRKRFALLHALYETSEGHRYQIVNLFELAEKLGIPKDEAHPIADWLSGEHLLEIKTHDGGIAITHEGIRQVEKALSSPDEPTDYFPPINIIYVGSMHHSQIQQGTLESLQYQSSADVSTDRLLEFIEEAKVRIDELSLVNNQRDEFIADLSTIEAQARSPKPKQTIIHEALASVKSILEAAAGQVAATFLLNFLSGLG